MLQNGTMDTAGRKIINNTFAALCFLDRSLCFTTFSASSPFLLISMQARGLLPGSQMRNNFINEPYKHRMLLNGGFTYVVAAHGSLATLSLLIMIFTAEAGTEK
jgi:hypothetical protein